MRFTCLAVILLIGGGCAMPPEIVAFQRSNMETIVNGSVENGGPITSKHFEECEIAQGAKPGSVPADIDKQYAVNYFFSCWSMNANSAIFKIPVIYRKKTKDPLEIKTCGFYVTRGKMTYSKDLWFSEAFLSVRPLKVYRGCLSAPDIPAGFSVERY